MKKHVHSDDAPAICKKEYLVDFDENDVEYETKIPITISTTGEEYMIAVDGVEWLRTNNPMQATVLFELMRSDLTEFMCYEEL